MLSYQALYKTPKQRAAHIEEIAGSSPHAQAHPVSSRLSIIEITGTDARRGTSLGSRSTLTELQPSFMGRRRHPERRATGRTPRCLRRPRRTRKPALLGWECRRACWWGNWTLEWRTGGGDSHRPATQTGTGGRTNSPSDAPETGKEQGAVDEARRQCHQTAQGRRERVLAGAHVRGSMIEAPERVRRCGRARWCTA